MTQFDSAIVVNTCRNEDMLTLREFVWPIQRALPIPSRVETLKTIMPEHMKHADVLIFSGCQLKDDAYVKKIPKLNWLKDIQKPVLGICAGQHILGMVHGAKLSVLKTPVVGVHKVKKTKTHTLLDNTFFHTFDVYSLHANQIGLLPKGFETIASSKLAKNEVIVHQTKPMVGVSFHPEVLNKPFFHSFLEWAEKNQH